MNSGVSDQLGSWLPGVEGYWDDPKVVGVGSLGLRFAWSSARR